MNQILNSPVKESLPKEGDGWVREECDRLVMVKRAELEAAGKGEFYIEKWLATFRYDLVVGMERGVAKGMAKALSRVIASGIPEAEAREWLNMQ